MKNSLYIFRIKTILNDKLTCFIMAFSVLVLLFIVNNLSINAGDRSSIPIGLLNLDRSDSAGELAGNIENVPALYVYEGTEKELRELLYKEEIKAYFIINEGYEKALRTEKLSGLVTMYYPKEDKSAKILSDLIAGEMLHQICLNKGYNLYRSLPWETVTGQKKGSSNRDLEKEYTDYANSLITLPDFNFAFDIRLVNIKNRDFEGRVENSVLYLQAVWGLAAMLLSFTAMMMTAGSVSEKETGIQSRVKISLLSPYRMDFNHFTASFTAQSILGVLIILSFTGRISGFTTKQGILLFLSMELFSAVMILWFLLLGKFTDRTGRYQLFGSLSILGFGLLGFLYLISGFIDEKLLNISKIIPNCWFIEEFTDIILKTSLQDIPYMSYIKLTITAVGLLILNGITGKRQYR